jgi:hypothetical protein
MKKVSLLFTVLALIFVSSSVSAQFTKARMITEWQRAKTYTKTYLDAMPEDGYGFKPTPDIRSFAQQMLHIADANYVFVTVASGKPSPIGESFASPHNINEKTVSPTKEAVTKAVMDSCDWVISTLQNMPAGPPLAELASSLLANEPRKPYASNKWHSPLEIKATTSKRLLKPISKTHLRLSKKLQ